MCARLETATRLSPECCERLVKSGATDVVFTLIRCCNRSVPCMDVITYSTQILLNLSKVRTLRREGASFSTAPSVQYPAQTFTSTVLDKFSSFSSAQAGVL